MFPVVPATPTVVAGSTPVIPAVATPEYLTKEEFSRSAAFIRGLSERIDGFVKNAPTMDLFVQMGMLDKAEDGTYKPKATVVAAPVKKDVVSGDEPWKLETDRLNGELKKRDDLLVAERRKAADTELTGAVVAALTKAGAVNGNRDAVHMKGITKNAAGVFIQMGKDEFGGDKEVTLDQAAINFLAVNLELRRAQGHAGSGTPGTGGNFTGTVATKAQMSDPTWYQANRKAVLAGTIQLAG